MNEDVARCRAIEDPGAFREALLECVDAVRCGPGDLAALFQDVERLAGWVRGAEKRAACREARERVAYAIEAIEAIELARAAAQAIEAGDFAIGALLGRLRNRLLGSCSAALRREIHELQDELRSHLGEDWRLPGVKAPEYVPTPAEIAEAAAVERAAWTPQVERERRVGRADLLVMSRVCVDPIRQMRTSNVLRKRA